MSYESFSSTALLIAFFIYTAMFLVFVISVLGKKWSNRDPEQHVKKWGKIGFIGSVIGFVSHATYFFVRWIGSGQIPTSNMYEFMTFLAMMVILAYIILYMIYRVTALGIFALPVGIIIIAYASVFPSEVQPLVPALQSYWLKIHVTTAAGGEAFFAVGFAAGLMYLLRTVNYKDMSSKAKLERRSIEFSLYVVLLVVAFVIAVFSFNAAGYHAQFSQQSTVVDKEGNEQIVTEYSEYVLPPIVQPYQSEQESMMPFLGLDKPLFEAPGWMEGVQAGRKLNTIIWTLITGTILYGLLRLIARRPLGQVIQPLLHEMDPEDLDEISYRSIAIGYPIYTLGALVFAMIWAHEAWGRFWGWDPKEVWALITWLFYAAYLHLRLSRGWIGKKSSWLAVIGFLVVMFTLVGVNLIIAGLHSYAGV